MAPGIDYSAFAVAQLVDEEMPAYQTVISGLVQLGPSGITVLCDVSTGQPRPIVRAAGRHRIFDVIHGLAHTSIRTKVEMVAACFMWHGLRMQVGRWAWACGRQCRSSQCLAGALTTFMWTTASIPGCLASSDGGGLLYAVVWGHSAHGHFCRARGPLDCQFRCPAGHFLGPGCSVHV